MDKEKRYYNYQKFDFVKYDGKICEVIGVLDTFGVNLIDKDGHQYEDVFVDDIEPIEITVELLEEIGYKYDGLFKSYVLNTGLFMSNFYPDTNKFTIHSKEFDAIKNGTYYIHEVQELFRFAWYNYVIIDWHNLIKLDTLN